MESPSSPPASTPPSAVLVTGGAGFIGSALVRALVAAGASRVINVDKLTYAGNPDAVASVAGDPRYQFERADVCDGPALRQILARHRPATIFHLAAESHVDRSIDAPADFVMTNVVGTFRLLEESQIYWTALASAEREAFRLVHASTDEVFGSLDTGGRFIEHSPYAPNSPYAASKAGSDHLVRAWHRTYGLPVIVTHSTNNYGPWQLPEKLIPLMIHHAAAGRPLPVYGDGRHVRDWIHVDDHVAALRCIADRGVPGGRYLIGAGEERTNLDVVHMICDLLDELRPDPSLGLRRELVRFVADRPGHDRRYALDAASTRALGWAPQRRFDEGLRETVRWYLAHRLNRQIPSLGPTMM